jgi:NAD(P)-dependent dehydrogenase (short-subunit alcohol dehydrogenase family)
VTLTLTDRIALVTGASRGIGAATANRLVELGARVVRVSRSALPPLANAIDYRGDLAAARPRGEILERIAADHGVPDIIVSNAGAFLLAPLEATSDELLREQVAINLEAPFAVARTFLPLMRTRGSGRHVLVGSVSDTRTFPGNTAYSASKFGVRGLHEVLLEEYRGSGVLCTLVSPGPTDTTVHLARRDAPAPRRGGCNRVGGDPAGQRRGGNPASQPCLSRPGLPVFIELTDLLRCPAAHDEAFLVLIPHQTAQRRVIAGHLGCPLCGWTTEWSDGVPTFGDAPTQGSAVGAPAFDAEAVVALLGISGPGGWLAVAGRAGSFAVDLGAMLPGVNVVAINPPPDVLGDERVSVVRARSWPLKRSMLRGVVIGADATEFTPDAVRSVLPGLRAMGEAGAPADSLHHEAVARSPEAWVVRRR